MLHYSTHAVYKENNIYKPKYMYAHKYVYILITSPRATRDDNDRMYK